MTDREAAKLQALLRDIRRIAATVSGAAWEHSIYCDAFADIESLIDKFDDREGAPNDG